jgi:hypothetical protein
LLAVVAATFGPAPARADAHPRAPGDATVINTWNEVTQRTLVENGVPIPLSNLYYAFVSLAMYDAVVAINGRYEPWAAKLRAHPGASTEVAAATAAYLVLRHYFPESATALNNDFRAMLGTVHLGADTLHGIWIGRAAAAQLIRLRAEDGRDAPVPQPGTEPFEPGEWRPTPPAFAPMAIPWLGFVDPIVLPSATAVPLGGPPALDSSNYASDFAEVRDLGGTNSSRTPDQTATALFWSANVVSQDHAAMRDQVTRRNLDIVDASRAFALLDSSLADALVACWRAKYDFNFWRPVTAIELAATDGNDETEAVPGWTPLVPTPPYGDYVSGHACATGAVTGSLQHLFGTTLDPAFAVPSLTAASPREYTTTTSLDTETMNARIWLGLHFRTAMIDGNALGHAVADVAATNHFRPSPWRHR